MKKTYIVDTNVLIEDPDCLKILRNGEENRVIIPYTVLKELDGLKKDNRIGHLIPKIIESIEENFNNIEIWDSIEEDNDHNDIKIIKEVKKRKEDINGEIITNDKIFRLLCKIKGIKSEEYLQSNPFISDSERYTGVVSSETEIPEYHNYFHIDEDGVPHFHGKDGIESLLNYDPEIWKVKANNMYQKMAFRLMLDPDIHLITIQSKAGYGKTYISLATALYLTLQKKLYSKVFVLKPTIEIGSPMGFLPGDMDEKMGPFVKPIEMLVRKLGNLREIRINDDKNPANKEMIWNIDKFEVLPLAYIRGCNIDNAVVIVDEGQNLTRQQTRSILTRMGQNVKCFFLGDVNQIDNIYLNPENNGLNWIVKKMKNSPNYAHIVLKGEKSRGSICDMALGSGI